MCARGCSGVPGFIRKWTACLSDCIIAKHLLHFFPFEYQRICFQLCFVFSQHPTDDSWINLSEGDLEDILSKYSDTNSKDNGTENGALKGEHTVSSDVSTHAK